MLAWAVRWLGREKINGNLTAPGDNVLHEAILQVSQLRVTHDSDEQRNFGTLLMLRQKRLDRSAWMHDVCGDVNDDKIDLVHIWSACVDKSVHRVVREQCHTKSRRCGHYAVLSAKNMLSLKWSKYQQSTINNVRNLLKFWRNLMLIDKRNWMTPCICQVQQNI